MNAFSLLRAAPKANVASEINQPAVQIEDVKSVVTVAAPPLPKPQSNTLGSYFNIKKPRPAVVAPPPPLPSHDSDDANSDDELPPLPLEKPAGCVQIGNFMVGVAGDQKASMFSAKSAVNVSAAAYHIPEFKRRDLPTPYPIGVCGLNNFGVTCWMNSTLQLMSTCMPMSDFFKHQIVAPPPALVVESDTQTTTSDVTIAPSKFELALQYSNFLRDACSGQSVIAPKLLRSAILRRNPDFQRGQQDAFEFLQFFLDGLQSDSKLEHGVDSPIQSLFQSVSQNNISCKHCDFNSSSAEALLSVSLSLAASHPISDEADGSKHDSAHDDSKKRKSCDDSADNIDLESCLKMYTAVTGNSDYVCPTCAMKREVEMQTSFRAFAPFVLVHLKRFQAVPDSTGSLAFRKDERRVSYPLRGLDMRTVIGDSENSTYDLVATINHYGNLNNGHYTAFALRPRVGSDCWMNFDDSEVQELADPLDAHSSNEENVYCLLYRRRAEAGALPTSDVVVIE